MKKLMSIILVLALVAVLVIPTFAAGGPTVSTSQSKNDVTITVQDGDSTYTSVVAFAKNKTQVYDVDGYGVEIVYNGSKVKSATIISVPVVEVIDEEEPDADDNQQEPQDPIQEPQDPTSDDGNTNPDENTSTGNSSDTDAALVGLEWMRSSEASGDAFIRPIVIGTDAFIYEDAVSKTPLRYFETDAARQAANERAETGNEFVYGTAGQITTVDNIWDNGSFYSKYAIENTGVALPYQWASWTHFGQNGKVDADNKLYGEYSMRRFTSYFDLSDSLYSRLEKAVLAPENNEGKMSFFFPINDTLFVFVNGQLAFWGGTDVKEGENVGGAIVRSEFMGTAGVPVINGNNALVKQFYPHTDGWCIDLEDQKNATDIKSLLQPGENRIDIITDDFYEGGGMNKVQLFVSSTPEEKVILSDLNWNNGKTSDKNGANGAGLIQFAVNGVTFRNNKNYITPDNFMAAISSSPGKNDNTNIYSVSARTVTTANGYEKVYDMMIAIFKDGEWNVYSGTITVDNPGGNNDRQQYDIFRIK